MFLRFTAAVLCALCLLNAAAFAQTGAAQQDRSLLNYGRGPVELGTQFPLAQLHASFFPESPRVVPQGRGSASAGLAWSNTLNRRRSHYVVDSEIRTLETRLVYSPRERWELKGEFPLIWRGAGVLDSAIYSWHDFFGLPQGARDDPGTEDDLYRISGDNKDGSGFELDNRGVKLGDAAISLKHLLSAGDDRLPALALRASVHLPSGAGQYGHQGIDTVLAVLASKRWSRRWIGYAGAGHVFLGEPETSGIEFYRNSAAAFAAAEFEATPDFSLLAALRASTALIKSIELFPEYEVYLDAGLKAGICAGTELELVLRENPAPGRGTADVTFFAGLRRYF